MKESKITLKSLFSVFMIDIIGITILTMLVSGCAPIPGCTINRMYSGPAMPSNRIALLTRDNKYVSLISFDGRRDCNYLSKNKELEILPGEHTIEIFYNDGHQSSIVSITRTFTAEPGFRYTIMSNVNRNHSGWNPWIGGRSFLKAK